MVNRIFDSQFCLNNLVALSKGVSLRVVVDCHVLEFMFMVGLVLLGADHVVSLDFDVVDSFVRLSQVDLLFALEGGLADQVREDGLGLGPVLVEDHGVLVEDDAGFVAGSEHALFALVVGEELVLLDDEGNIVVFAAFEAGDQVVEDGLQVVFY